MPLSLKSLELQGYKTFANRTVFEFAGQVTAIVGPNGSGKSNIADSLRWVLGEQSYSLLRARRTEDMIFSGSEQRARSGMAAATIVFDNFDGWLPIEYGEVAITRRAYRDGQNEYLINGQRVRLKDVSELLAQSGLAERTYTIIGQGVVDAALALRADERRRLFEEAAGIGLYRSRREEALRRLDATQRNLERVQDILAELKPRLRSLERQARRAQEFEQVRDDLRVMLREWYGYHWHRAQQELAAARVEARREEKSLEKARRAQTEQDSKLGGIRREILELRTQLNDWQTQLSGLNNQRVGIIRQRAVGDERQRSLSEQTHSLQLQITRLEEEVRLYRERFEAAAQDVSQQETEREEARTQAESAGATLRSRQDEREAAEDAVQSARQALADLAARQGELSARQSTLQTMADRRSSELAEVIQTLRVMEETLNSARQRVQVTQETQKTALDEYETIQARLVSHNENIQETEAALKRVQGEYSKAGAEAARLQAQLEVLDQAERALAGYTSGAQALLKAARDERLPGARGALSSQLQVSGDLETAIAAALGEYLDAIVLEDDNSADAALDLLAQETVRGVLLPLTELQAATALNLPENREDWGEGVLGVAADLVSTAQDLQPVLNLLLGRTVVVHDRKAAQRLIVQVRRRLGSSAPPDLRAVTLKGEVFHASGPVALGQEGKATTLGRPRQRSELQAGLAELDERIARLQKQIEELESGFARAGEERKRLEAEVSAAKSKLEQQEAAYSRELAAFDSAEHQLEWQSGQRERLEAEVKESQEEGEQISAELSSLAERVSERRESLRLSIQQLAELSLEEYQAQAAHWETLYSVAKRALEEAQARLEERRELLNRSEQELAEARERYTALEDALEGLEEQGVAQREDATQVDSQIEALKEQIQPAETALFDAESRYEKLLNSESEFRKALSMAEHHNAQARIGLARRQEALETWRRRIEDDFGLVAFDYVEDIAGPNPLPMKGLVEQLPRIEKLSPELEENLRRQRALLRRIGAVNPDAMEEYGEVKERVEFMEAQLIDLNKAEADVRRVITELDEIMHRELRSTFDAVAEEFSGIFRRLFGGGAARLILTDPDDMGNTGVEIEARLPGRRTQGLALLSGGERSLTATALVFALLRVSPTPFCLLDEVDAMLDEANVGRFRELLRELSEKTQFVIVTHNRNTVQVADVIYGVTMGRDSASQIISLKLDEVEQVVE